MDEGVIREEPEQDLPPWPPMRLLVNLTPGESNFGQPQVSIG